MVGGVQFANLVNFNNWETFISEEKSPVFPNYHNLFLGKQRLCKHDRDMREGSVCNQILKFPPDMTYQTSCLVWALLEQNNIFKTPHFAFCSLLMMRFEREGQRWYWILGRWTIVNWCPHPPITGPTLFIGRNCNLMSGSGLHKCLYPVSNTERWKTDYGRHQRQVNVRKIINILQCCSHSILVLVSSDRSLSQGPGDQIIISDFLHF